MKKNWKWKEGGRVRGEKMTWGGGMSKTILGEREEDENGGGKRERESEGMIMT